MGPLLEGKPRLYLRECLSARSSSTLFPESVSSRLMERNFFKGILNGKKMGKKSDLGLVICSLVPGPGPPPTSDSLFNDLNSITKYKRNRNTGYFIC